VSDFCSAAVLISFGAIIGKASLSQLIIMAFVEVVLQSVNEFIGINYLQVNSPFEILKLFDVEGNETNFLFPPQGL
jgi:hypothetical protein